MITYVRAGGWVYPVPLMVFTICTEKSEVFGYRVAIGLSLASVVLQLGCASNQQEQVRSPMTFPTKEALLALGPARPIETIGQDNVVRVEGHRLTGPFPMTLSLQPYEDPSPLGVAIEQRVSRGRGKVSTSVALRCAARELGSFVLEHGALPAPGLQRFVFARCGSLVSSPRLLSWGHPVPETDDTWMQAGARAMDEKLDALVEGERVSVGAWAGRRDDHAFMIAVAGERSVSLAPVRIAPDANNRIILQGTVQVPADNVAASINLGTYGVGRCWTDPGVHLPNFAVHCTMAPTDSSAWVQLVAERRENLLSETVLRVLVQRNDQGELDYRAPHDVPSRPVHDAAGFRAALIDQVNVVRGRAGVRPLRLLDAQSALADKVSPHFFVGREGEDLRTTQDQVAFGLLAGWDVGGTIRGGDFLAVASPTVDAGHWLADMLEQPMARETLLSAEAEGLAAGVVVQPETPVLASLVTTYSFFEGFDHTAEATKILQRLQSYRAWYRQPPATPLVLPNFSAICHEVTGGRMSVRDGMERLLHATSMHWNRPTAAHVVETVAPDAVQFAPDLLRYTPPWVGIGVCHRKAPDAPWGHYVLFFVYTPVNAPGQYAQNELGND